MKVMRPVFSVLFACTCFGCQDVLVEPPIHEAARPAPPMSSLGCGVVRSDYGNARYWMADLETERSCINYLEQDDCVFGIFDDCTWPRRLGKRQWFGQASPLTSGGDQLTLSSVVFGTRAMTQAPSATCVGVLRDPSAARTFGRLVCSEETPPSSELWIERFDDAARPFAERAQSILLVRPPASAVTTAVLSQMTAMSVEGRNRLFVPYNWTSDRGVGGLWRVDLVDPVPQPVRVLDVPFVARVGAMRGAALLLVAAFEPEARQGSLHLMNARTELGTKSTTVGEVIAVASTSDESAWITIERVRDDYTQSKGVVRSRDSLKPMFEPRVIEGFEVRALLTLVGRSDVPIVAAATTLRERYLVGLTNALDVVFAMRVDTLEEGEVSRSGRALSLVDLGNGVVGLSPLGTNRYVEVDTVTKKVVRVSAIPFFASTADLAYDAAQDRVFVLSRMGEVTQLERNTGRVDQGTLRLVFDRKGSTNDEERLILSSAVWDANLKRLFVLAPDVGQIEEARVSR